MTPFLIDDRCPTEITVLSLFLHFYLADIKNSVLNQNTGRCFSGMKIC